jgi:hypothetical protein
VITRLSRGWTARNDADAYERFLLISRCDERAQHFTTSSFDA